MPALNAEPSRAKGRAKLVGLRGRVRRRASRWCFTKLGGHLDWNILRADYVEFFAFYLFQLTMGGGLVLFLQLHWCWLLVDFLVIGWLLLL